MKNAMKKTLAAVMALVLALSLVACGEIAKAEGAVNGLLTALKTGDMEQVMTYTGSDELISEEELLGGGVEVAMALFGKMEYSIVSSEQVDDDTVNVTVEVTNVDMKVAMGQFMMKALEYAFSNAFADPQPTEEETTAAMIGMLGEVINDPEATTTTGQATLVVNKTDAGWIVDVDDAAIDVISGGIVTAAERMEESFGG